MQLVVGKDQKHFVVKYYFKHPSDQRDRLLVEYSAYQFLRANGIDSVPTPIAIDREYGIGIYSYIEGEKLGPSDISNSDIDSVVSFVSQLKQIKKNATMAYPFDASEACFSIQAFIDNISFRTERLLKLPLIDAQYSRLNEFLKKEFIPFFHSLVKVQSYIPLVEELKTLSPSDFGFHNVIKRSNGELAFVDFEYFGLDDPAKMISDFLLHPNPCMAIAPSKKQNFYTKFIGCFDNDQYLRSRIKTVYYFIGLKWCLIILNEFLPNDALRRDFAKQVDGSPSSVELRLIQLEKAVKMLNKIKLEYIDFPYN